MREKLPDRRPSTTQKLEVVLDNGKVVNLQVTIGFRDEEQTKPAEVFCADFKAGTVIHAMLMDACILISRLLQHGDSPQEIAATLCNPPSIIGSIALSVVKSALRGSSVEGPVGAAKEKTLTFAALPSNYEFEQMVNRINDMATTALAIFENASDSNIAMKKIRELFAVSEATAQKLICTGKNLKASLT